MCHKGFSEYSNAISRLNFRFARQANAIQSITAHTLFC